MHEADHPTYAGVEIQNIWCYTKGLLCSQTYDTFSNMTTMTKFKVIWRKFKTCVISGFCHEVDEKCILLCYYAASSCNSLLTFWETWHSQLQGSRRWDR